jgi:excisionase family DNA binding protein
MRNNDEITFTFSTGVLYVVEGAIPRSGNDPLPLAAVPGTPSEGLAGTASVRWRFAEGVGLHCMRTTDRDDDLLLLTIKQVAARLGCSMANVYLLVAGGELPVVRVGRFKGYRVDYRDLESFVNDRKFRYAAQAPRPARLKLKHLRA